MNKHLKALGILCLHMVSCVVGGLVGLLVIWTVEHYIHWAAAGIVIVGLLAFLYWIILTGMES